jgi:hypothetical protein
LANFQIPKLAFFYFSLAFRKCWAPNFQNPKITVLGWQQCLTLWPQCRIMATLLKSGHNVKDYYCGQNKKERQDFPHRENWSISGPIVIFCHGRCCCHSQIPMSILHSFTKGAPCAGLSPNVPPSQNSEWLFERLNLCFNTWNLQVRHISKIDF